MKGKMTAKNIYLVGIGGAGMTALAFFLRDCGCKVKGSDILLGQNVKMLLKNGFTVYKKHSADNIKGADAVIYTAAVKKSNVEVCAAKKLGIKTLERGKALKLISKRFKNVIAVSGTHGKTTVANLIFHIFKSAGLCPSSLIGGGYLKNPGGIFNKHRFLVCEACEYAGNFLKLRPDVGVVLNIDNDHLECYGSKKRLIKAFEKFAKKSKLCIAKSDIADFKQKKYCITFGFKADDKYRAVCLCEKDGCYNFELYGSGKYIGKLDLKIPGKHNVLNALAAVAVALEQGIEFDTVKRAVESFKGAKRRFEQIYKTKDFTLYDDYAHHPAEIETVIRSARESGYPFVTLVFQPFTFSRTALLLDDFVKVLGKADRAIICPVMGGRETNKWGVCSYDIIKKLSNAEYAENFEQAARLAIKETKRDGCIVTVGCGNVYEVGRRVVALSKDLK